jgi:hypothetical protein
MVNGTSLTCAPEPSATLAAPPPLQKQFVKNLSRRLAIFHSISEAASKSTRIYTPPSFRLPIVLQVQE